MYSCGENGWVGHLVTSKPLGCGLGYKLLGPFLSSNGLVIVTLEPIFPLAQHHFFFFFQFYKRYK